MRILSGAAVVPWALSETTEMEVSEDPAGGRGRSPCPSDGAAHSCRHAYIELAVQHRDEGEKIRRVIPS